jgi:hypothetical protein
MKSTGDELSHLHFLHEADEELTTEKPILV